MELTRTPDDGTERLSLLTRDHRRALGKVYTSPALAEFILDRALGHGNLPAKPVLDPSAGAGVFLLACLERIIAEVDAIHDVRSHAGTETLIERARYELWGIDVDEAAVELARKALRSGIEQAVGTDVDPSLFDKNVVVGDFLEQGIERLAIDGRPALIIGNPPYVPADRLAPADKTRYRQRFATAHGRLDLYTLFMEQATRVLDAAGSFAFITPDKYLSSVSASRLRELLRSNGHVASLGIFTSHRVFDDAATVPCVTVWREGSHHEVCRHVQVDRLSLDSDVRRTPRVDETQLVDPRRLTESSWSLQRRSHEPLEEILTAGHQTLGAVTERISAGLTTGYNPAFILDMSAASMVEPELVHPTVGGRDVLANEIRFRDRYMLVPYEWDGDGKPRLIDLDRFPYARRWLTQHRDRLEARHCVRVWGKAWWDLHDPVGQPLHALPKVLVPDLARSNRFAADDGRFIPQHSLYYLTSTSVPVTTLTAVLNSPAVEFLVRTRAPMVKDGFSRYRRQFLIDLPVPEVSADTHAAIRLAVEEQRHDDLADLTCGLFGVETERVVRAIASLDASRPRSARVTAGAGRVPTARGAAAV